MTAPGRLHRALGAVMDGAKAKDFDPAQAVKIAADDITKLRKTDVFRVLEQTPAAHLNKVVAYIKSKRPDLAAEVDESRADL
jgi:hypothetical protein